jgi:hypothetical protein
MQGVGQLQPLGSRRRLPDLLEPRRGGDQVTDGSSEHRLVVDREHRHGPGRGLARVRHNDTLLPSRTRGKGTLHPMDTVRARGFASD